MRSLKGRTLEAYEAILVCGTPWNAVRLLAPGSRIDINCTMESIPVNDNGEVEEFGVVSVRTAPPEKLEVEGVRSEPSTFSVGKVIERIAVLDWTGTILFEEAPILETSFTQAIAFLMDDGEWLAFDQAVSFGEELFVRQGKRLEELLASMAEAYDFGEEDYPKSGTFSDHIVFL